MHDDQRLEHHYSGKNNIENKIEIIKLKFLFFEICKK